MLPSGFFKKQNLRFGLVRASKTVITSDARYFIVDLVMSILRLYMVIFSPSKLISFTKLRFRLSFWVVQHAKILIGSKAMTKNTKGFISVFYHFVKQKAENLCLINGHFKTIFGHFFGNYINIFQKIEIQTIILRCLVSQNLNWIKSYDIETDSQNLQIGKISK